MTVVLSKEREGGNQVVEASAAGPNRFMALGRRQKSVGLKMSSSLQLFHAPDGRFGNDAGPISCSGSGILLPSLASGPHLELCQVSYHHLSSDRQLSTFRIFQLPQLSTMNHPNPLLNLNLNFTSSVRVVVSEPLDI